MSKIIEALGQLDTADNDHWTVEGLPRLDVVKRLAGDDGITREDLRAVAPAFNRSNPTVPGNEPALPNITDDMVNEETGEVDTSELTDRQKAELELTIAREEFAKAEVRLASANEAMDVFILAEEEQKQKGTTLADEVRLFTQSEAIERAKASQRREALKASLTPEEFKRVVDPK